MTCLLWIKDKAVKDKKKENKRKNPSRQLSHVTHKIAFRFEAPHDCSVAWK